ncbi:MAG: class I SAM-dependent rRNA methyltransferase [Gemmataceae bacterium]
MRVVLKPKRARPFFGRHPWVFAGAIDAVEGDPADGDVVDLVSHTGNFVARGLFNSKSKIRVRLYCWEESRPIDADFFRDRLRFAIALRQQLGMMSPREACRLVSSEGDGLSGLTVDRYGSWLVMQFTSLALGLRRELLADLLQEMVQPEGIYLRTERGIGDLEGIALEDGPLRGQVPSGPLLIEENGLRFQVNIAEGQKTGYYLDQRDNRVEAAKLAPGRRVLDAFCYTGGFALQAARAGAAEVIGVDGSESALALARLNAANNGLDQRVHFHQEDVFQDLDRRVRQGERFGLVILDPPKFARRKGSVEDALRGYRRLQSLALKLLEPGGFLVSCCCSGLITLAMLEELMAQVAAEARRDIQLLQRRGPSPDHPVAVACLESHYLKCLLTRVG